MLCSCRDCLDYMHKMLYDRFESGVNCVADNSVVNKGILRENFRIFHIRDNRAVPVETHFHDFDKVVLMLTGRVEYIVEGTDYELSPGDILFVRHHDVHRPVMCSGENYERVILWINPDYLELCSRGMERLGSCFDLASEKRACLFHPEGDEWRAIRRNASELEDGLEARGFANELLMEALFVQLMVRLNRCALEPPKECTGDGRLEQALRYITEHLGEDLSVDRLSGMCFLSRYYFMRRFKEKTGYSVHSYVSLKRMTEAARLLSAGVPAAEAAAQVGFDEYSSFLRAFKKQFGCSPTGFARRRDNFSDAYTE